MARNTAAFPLAILLLRFPQLLSGQNRPLLKTARAELSVSGIQIELRVSAWLNLMGERDSEPGAPLRIVARLRSLTGGPLPQGLQLDSAFLFGDQHEWAPVLEPDGVSDTAIVARVWDGPSWLLKADSLDVIVRIQAPGQPYQYLRAPRVALRRAI